MNRPNWKEAKRLFHAAIELPANEREEFLAVNCENEDLRREVEELLVFHEKDDEFIKNAAGVETALITNETDFIGQQIGPYKIVREIGRGGMGIVFEALRDDGEFRQQVALKIIKRGMDTDFILKRFRNERQILAALNHPHIARLLDGGTTNDGLPYLVMEYIEGEPLLKFCNAKQFSVAERLNIFLQISAAVTYAHQNLIIHRDIKPSNLFVTSDGIPKLLDFGIAKIINPELDAGETTETFARLFTPEYASPEQIRGENITTGTDVYSLGMVLYELLTGRHPFRQKKNLAPHEWMREICETEPVKPSDAITRRGDSETRRDEKNPPFEIKNAHLLRGDLDKIILKALQKDPARRYASVEQFSEDIRRHLKGLPVIAQTDSVRYRAQKFIKRHRVGVFAGGFIFLSLLLGILATTWQAYRANAERAKAEKRFNQVRKLANLVLFEYHDGIQKLAGSTQIREKMVRDALEYLDNLSTESGNSADLLSEVAAAYQKVGDVQGAPFKANLGDYAGALESYKKALAIREKLFAEDKDNEKLKLDLTRSYQMIGHVSQLTNNLPGALENYRKAFAIFDLMINKNLETERELNTLYTRFANALLAGGNLSEAMEIHQKAVIGYAELIKAYPDDNELKRDLGIANLFLSDALTEMGDLKNALAAQRTAYGLFESLVTPTNAQAQRDLGVVNGRISRTLFKMGDYRGALEIEFKILKVDEELLKSDPQNAMARRDVHIDYYKVARLQSALGDYRNALFNQKKSVELCEAEVKANPASSEARADLGVAYFRLAEILENTGKLTEALENYKKALTIEENSSNADPTNTDLLGNLAEDYMKVGDISLKLGDHESALKSYLKSLKINQDLAAASPESQENKTSLALVFDSLGAYYALLARNKKQTENWEEAKNHYQQSLKIWQELKASEKLPAEYSNKPEEIKQNLEKCELALTKPQR